MAPTDKKAKKDKWSEEETLALCEFLNKYVTEHGRNVQFKWVEIQPKFATLFKRTFVSEKALKNKFDGMKREYNLWTSLKNGETGLGWDANANKLDCSDEWWDMKIKEDPNFKKLKKKQPSLELQYAWDQLYGDAVAGGDDCVSTSMDAKAFKEVHHKNVDKNVEAEYVESDDDLDGSQDGTQVQNSDMEKLENEGPGFFKTFLDEVNLADTTTPPNQSGIPKKIHKPTKANTKPKTITMKRRGRQSGGSAMLKEHLAQSKATQQRVIQYLESETSTNNQSNKFSIDAVASVINHMIEAELIIKGSTLWLFAMDLFEDPVKREMFMSMPDDECRITWLQHKQNKST
ncbi:myb/SANT-like domain-containing protein [Artemisia annua]|uniref:Myb/SANT-like domain-containing protein n=1 Tax=Artemisia annua TaxID=35608 RepID=A0A2U1LB99_ARTAN|nr:myb/SANT-like domain-containing protein [Artemisia annua]